VERNVNLELQCDTGDSALIIAVQLATVDAKLDTVRQVGSIKSIL
jgi:hypothetical protein